MSTIKTVEIKSNYTKNWFRFPITLYITKDMESSHKMLEDLGIPIEEPEGVVGFVECYPDDIVYIYDSFSRPRAIEDVKQNGFDSTAVILRSGEMFSCIWDRKTFKEKLNAHIDKTIVENMEDVRSKLKEAFTEIETKMEAVKVPWWKRWFR